MAPHMHFGTSATLWLQRFDQLCAGANIDLSCAAARAGESLYYRRFLCACAARRLGVLDGAHLARELETLFGAQAHTFAPAVRAAAALARATAGVLASAGCRRLLRHAVRATPGAPAPAPALAAAREAAQRELGPDAQLFRIGYETDGLYIVPEACTLPEAARDDSDAEEPQRDGSTATGASATGAAAAPKQEEKEDATGDVVINIEDRRTALEFPGHRAFDAGVTQHLGDTTGMGAAHAGPPALLRRSCVPVDVRAEQDRLAGTRSQLDCTLGLGEQVRAADQRLTFVSGTEDTMHWSTTTVGTGSDMLY